MGVASGTYSLLLNFCCVTLLSQAVQAGLVINEFLPDPTGSDGGREYVELLNSGDTEVSLATVKLEFANGAVGAEWVTRWAGAAVTLAPGQRFLLVDRNWLGAAAADVEVYLGLQNGPDAIRLTDAGLVLDLVGYGPLTDAALFETKAVPLKSGRALARRPDGIDTNDNSIDFVSADLTPGAPNFSPFSFLVQEVTWDPPFVARPGDSLRLTLVLLNNGVQSLPGRPCRVLWPGGEVASWCDQTPPDATRTLSFLLRPRDRAVVTFAWEYVVPSTGDTLRYDLGRVQVGAAALRLNEVLPVPGQGQGEWVEIQWWGAQPLDLAGYRLRDEDGSWRELPEVLLRPGAMAVVTEDSAAFVSWREINELSGLAACADGDGPAQIIALSTWPSLNNTPPVSRLYADRIYLADPAGVVLDAVAWGGPEHEQPERDLSLARIAPEALAGGIANWTISTSQLGATPGCRNSVTAGQADLELGKPLLANPVLLDLQGGASTCHLLFTLAPPERSWQLKIFNLWGDLVRDFGGDERGTGPRDLIWNATDDAGQLVPKGAYLVWLEVRDGAGVIGRRNKIRLVVR